MSQSAQFPARERLAGALEQGVAGSVKTSLDRLHTCTVSLAPRYPSAKWALVQADCSGTG